VFLRSGAQIDSTFSLRINNTSRPIDYKHREGMVKRTLKRELKVPEIVNREANIFINL